MAPQTSFLSWVNNNFHTIERSVFDYRNTYKRHTNISKSCFQKNHRINHTEIFRILLKHLREH